MASVGADSSHVLARQLDGFKKKHGIEVELRLIPWGRAWAFLTKAIKERDLPDLFQMGSTWLATLSYLNILSEVPDGIWVHPAITPWVEATASYGGVRWAVPWTVECNVLAAREDLLDAAGLTLEQLAEWPRFLEACRLLARRAAAGERALAGVVPIALHCRPDSTTLHWAAPWLWSGGWHVDPASLASASVLADESTTPGFQYISNLCRVSPMLKEMANASAGRVINDFFVEGRYAFYTGHSVHALKRLLPGPGEFSPNRRPFVILPLPRGPAGSISRGGTSLLGVARTSRQPGSAWELVRYLTTDPSLSELADATGEMPTLECQYWREGRHCGTRRRLLHILSTARTYPSHRLWRTIESLLIGGISEIFWHFLEGKPHEAASRRIARHVDDRIEALLGLGWGVAT